MYVTANILTQPVPDAIQVPCEAVIDTGTKQIAFVVKGEGHFSPQTYAKAQAAVYGSLPVKGRAFVSVANRDKRSMIFPVKRLADLGFEIWATEGTAEVLRRNGVRAKIVRKHGDGPGPSGEPTVVTRILAGEVDLIVNTPFGSPGQSGPRLDGYEIRTAAVRRGIPCVTTAAGLAAAVHGIEAIIRGEVGVRSLQEHAASLGSLLAGARSGGRSAPRG